MTSYINIFTLRRFCTLQGFQKYKNEVSSPSNSIVIESERFFRASADLNPHFRFKSGENMSLEFFHQNKS